jgi:hypothetical protein
VRQFVYQYNGSERLKEVEDDPTGRREIPSVGSIIKRKGREWKVIHVSAPVFSNGTTPIVRLFLSGWLTIEQAHHRKTALP